MEPERLDLKIYGGSMMISLIVTLSSLSVAGTYDLIERRNERNKKAADAGTSTAD